jgi:hypothetical protein
MEDIEVKISPDIIWIIEAKGILVTNTKNSHGLFLRYPEAAVWSILVKYGISAKAINILSAICKTTEKRSAKLIENSINEWKIQGLIIAS